MKTVYLAGPITDCNAGEANNWRQFVQQTLKQYNIRGISPLRCEPLHGDRYVLSSQDPRFGTARAIASKNFLDVQTCDMTLCYLERTANMRRLSVGTLMELAWAHAMGKPTILVSDYLFLTEHPVVQANASWILATLPEAIDVIVGVLGDYCQ